MRTTASVAMVILSLGAACQRPTAAPDPGAAKAALEAASRQYEELGKTKDLNAFLSYYSADASMYPPAGPTATGLDAIRAVGSAFLADPAFAGTFRPVATEVSADGSMGYTLTDAELTVTGPDKKPVTERLRDFHVWRRQADGTWKIVVDIWNAQPPATPSAKP